MALSPLYVTTAGLDTTKPFTLTLSNLSGFSPAVTPIRVESDGTIVLAVPLNIDPNSGQTTAYNASLTITQGTLVSAPVQLSVQDIPPLSAYGTTLGAISRAFFNYQEASLARMLNSLQAIQALPSTPGTVNTSNAQIDIQTQLTNIIEARNNIDRVITTNSTEILIGTLPSGTPINFDQNSVAIMDRILGVYLTTLQPSFAPSAVTRRHTLIERPKPETVNWNAIIQTLGAINSGETIGGAVRTTLQSSSSLADDIISIGQGSSALVGLAALGAGAAGVAGAPVVVAGAAIAGVVFGVAAIVNDVYHIETDTSQIAQLSNSGTDPTSLAQAQVDLTASQKNLAFDTVGTILTPFTIPAEGAATFGQGIVQLLTEAGSGVIGTSISGAQLVNGTLQLYSQNQAINDADAIDAAAGQFTTPFSSTSDGFGDVVGTVSITNSEGPILSGLTGVSINSTSGVNFTTIGDSNGDYDILVPLGSTTLNYGNMTIDAFDPVSDDALDTLSLNLDQLLSSPSLLGPTLNGSCNDTDAGDPDSDDPDCD